MTELDEEDFAQFVRVMLTPTRPNELMKRGIEKYNMNKEWCEKMARREAAGGDPEIGIGPPPAAPLTVELIDDAGEKIASSNFAAYMIDSYRIKLSCAQAQELLVALWRLLPPDKRPLPARSRGDAR